MTSKFLFENDSLKKFPINDYPFHKVLADLFRLNNLANLHSEFPKVDDYNQDLGKDSQSHHHILFYNAIKDNSSPLRILWDKFLRNIVAGHFPKESPLIVQALPSLRIHIPGAKAVNRWHFDSDKEHNHPIGEINCLIALTEMYGKNSVWRESKPNQEDFMPFELSIGEMVYWNGNTCTHGNYINDTNVTRLSLDFRIFPRKKYLLYLNETNKSNTNSATTGLKFKLGSYYKEVL